MVLLVAEPPRRSLPAGSVRSASFSTRADRVSVNSAGWLRRSGTIWMASLPSACTAAGATAEHLTRRNGLPSRSWPNPGIADGLLVGRHAAVDRLRDDRREQPEAAQQHERARIGRGRPFRRDQRTLRREHDVEDLADALVDMDLGRAFGRVGEIAQDRRDPFDEKRAAGIVGRPVDRTGRLRIGAGEVERDALALRSS